MSFPLSGRRCPVLRFDSGCACSFPLHTLYCWPVSDVDISLQQVTHFTTDYFLVKAIDTAEVSVQNTTTFNTTGGNTMKIDIRNEAAEVREIVFGDSVDCACRLEKSEYTDVPVYIADGLPGNSGSWIPIRDLLDAENLLRALERAIDLGWFNK
ncbi:hypothetical protein BN405_2-10_Ab1_orf_82 [Pseudomonas phage vB_PaeM_C2-10_Ab1]|uniref:Uncharacterized protein n=2 Tax=Pakpunavirus CAb1 TaxID=1921408 RepID=K4RLF7_9CAUD|nr:hypothetical protein BN405_2-10_Ab1_orf_82 [Pseudomonas phage vB_PaeM_C2-10_Ab1]CCM43626.1 hypothetical protein BN405_2-10_Ab1_orf_82 [Pseudomonas phage vB_PaeM_C2-10_Ab1]